MKRLFLISIILFVVGCYHHPQTGQAPPINVENVVETRVEVEDTRTVIETPRVRQRPIVIQPSIVITPPSRPVPVVVAPAPPRPPHPPIIVQPCPPASEIIIERSRSRYRSRAK